MELKDFLLLLFDKSVDRFPLIRESFLLNFNIYEVINLIAIANYHCRKSEMLKYVDHTFEDVGIRIQCNKNIIEPDSGKEVLNTIVVSNTRKSIRDIFLDWTDVRIDSDHRIWLDTSNTDIILYLSKVSKEVYIGDGYSIRPIHMTITIKPKNKVHKTYRIRLRIESDSLGPEDTDKSTALMINTYCLLLTMISEKIYTWCDTELVKYKKTNEDKKNISYLISPLEI